MDGKGNHSENQKVCLKLQTFSREVNSTVDHWRKIADSFGENS
jgi:hypothetical protein